MPFVYIVPVKSGLGNQTLVGVAINMLSVDLGISAVIGTKIYNSNNNVCFTEEIPLIGQAYTDWGNDDAYITNYVLNYYNFTALPVETTAQPTIEATVGAEQPSQ